MPDETDSRPGDESPRRRHMLIAGTGRAGTSFLVRYLDRLGLQTDIDSRWDDTANAGGETRPLASGALPYVIKSPWTSEFVDQLLADRRVALEVAIIPVRDLSESVTSRVVLERRAMYAAAPEMAHYERTWESWGITPGGIVYSLNPVDQGRILAVGFHHLVQRLVEADIPIVLPAFPRMVEDGEYLFRKLRPYLPDTVTVEAAEAAHGSIADMEKVRVGREIRQADAIATGAVRYESDDRLDLIATKRELLRLRDQNKMLAGLSEEVARLRVESGTLAAANDEIARLRADREALMAVQKECARLRSTLDAREANPNRFAGFLSSLGRRASPAPHPRTARAGTRRKRRPTANGRGGQFYWKLFDETLGDLSTEAFRKAPESSIIFDSSEKTYARETRRVRERFAIHPGQATTSFRIVLSNHALRDRAGSELWTHDMARFLSASGLEVLVHSPELGPIAELIASTTSARVTSSTADVLEFEPHIVHVNHYRPAEEMVAAVARTTARIVNMCHGLLPRAGLPMPSGADRYWAASIMAKTKIWLLTNARWKDVSVIPNFFDGARYPPPVAGTRGGKALLFSRRANPQHVVDLAKALERQGYELETAGDAARILDNPESILPGYDLVFAVGRSAIESLASGCRVMLWDHGLLGPTVTPANFWECVTANFALNSRLLPCAMMEEDATEVWLAQQLAPASEMDRQQVLELTRTHLSLANVGRCIVSLYGELLSEPRARFQQ